MRAPQRLVARSVAVLVVAAVLAACGSDGTETAGPAATTVADTPTTTTEAPTTTTDPAPTPTVPNDPNVIIHATPDIGAADVEMVRQAVTVSRNRVGDIDRPTDVYVYMEATAFEDTYIDVMGLPASRKGNLVNELANNNTGLTTRDGRGAVFLTGRNIFKPYQWVTGYVTAAHETMHTFQTKAADDIGPLWLYEGQATLFGFRMAYEHHEAPMGMTWHDLRADIIVPKAQIERRPLAELRTGDALALGAGESVYSKGALASEWLEHHAGPDAIHQLFWTKVGSMGWQTAFSDTFGITVDDFYARFAAWEAAGYPPLA